MFKKKFKPFSKKGVKISYAGPFSVQVEDGQKTQIIDLDEIVGTDDIVSFEESQYIVRISLVLHTKHRETPTEFTVDSLEDAIDLVDLCKRFAQAPQIQEIPIDFNDFDGVEITNNLQKREQGISSMDIPFCQHIVRSADVAYINQNVAQTLFAMHVKWLYKVLDNIGKAFVAKKADNLEGYTIKMQRYFSPKAIKHYVSDEAMQKMLEANKLFAENTKVAGFWYLLLPQHIYEYFGGKADSPEFISSEFLRIAESISGGH